MYECKGLKGEEFLVSSCSPVIREIVTISLRSVSNFFESRGSHPVLERTKMEAVDDYCVDAWRGQWQRFPRDYTRTTTMGRQVVEQGVS